MTDEMVEALPRFRDSAFFSPAEKAALRLADAMAGDLKQARYDEIFAEPENTTARSRSWR